MTLPPPFLQHLFLACEFEFQQQNPKIFFPFDCFAFSKWKLWSKGSENWINPYSYSMKSVCVEWLIIERFFQKALLGEHDHELTLLIKMAWFDELFFLSSKFIPTTASGRAYSRIKLYFWIIHIFRWLKTKFSEMLAYVKLCILFSSIAMNQLSFHCKEDVEPAMNQANPSAFTQRNSTPNFLYIRRLNVNF